MSRKKGLPDDNSEDWAVNNLKYVSSAKKYLTSVRIRVHVPTPSSALSESE